MVNIRGEGWKEVKVGTVYAIELRLEPDKATQERFEMPHAVNIASTAVWGSKPWRLLCGLSRFNKVYPPPMPPVSAPTARNGSGISWLTISPSARRVWSGIMRSTISRLPLKPYSLTNLIRPEPGCLNTPLPCFKVKFAVSRSPWMTPP